ncbi:alpha/beta hydrolase [Neorhizobium sp. S3-V5DH]|uniref:alpha/beta hydrolase n=1 Tax=Neorhizobium sp. S3-V5DH TaxID=2485166 RepID=UPI0010429A4C|nr:alpha/beta hydrolase [Neorhizobium sp. S3-V5DH]TCV69319.1 arylformamidase [Neorhizobium sp. S3-V5DH]
MSEIMVLNNPDYSNQRAVPNYEEYFSRWRLKSKDFRQSSPSFLDVPYGNGWRQTSDIFPQPLGGKAPVVVFIHGGWWYFLDKRDHSFLVQPYHEGGCVCVCVTYPLAPAATISEIVASVRSSLLWVYRNIERFGGDPDRIHIAGHSAGGHLTAMMMATDWSAFNAPTTLVKSGCAVSGLFDLQELVSAPHNANIRMLPEEARQNSPVHLIPVAASPLIVSVGRAETAGFVRQHTAFVDAWQSERRPLLDASLDGENHFSVIEKFGDSSSELFEVFWEQINGAAAGR